MPLDSPFQRQVPDLRKPSAVGLIYLLRNRDVWPPRFRWDYGGCHTCALGLACTTWKNIGYLGVADAIGIPFDRGQEIFTRLRRENSTCDVRPKDVADALEDYILSYPPIEPKPRWRRLRSWFNK